MDAKQIELARKIANDPQGYAMVKENSNALKALVAAAFAETNPAMKKGLDIAARLTDAGKAALAATGGAQPTETAPMTTTAADAGIIALGTDFIVPEKAAKAVRAKNNFGGQFDNTAVGSAFYVPAAEGVKHPFRAVKLAARAQARAGVKRFDVHILAPGAKLNAAGAVAGPAGGMIVKRLPDASGPAEAKPRKAKAAA
jgi:hypothetical protein